MKIAARFPVKTFTPLYYAVIGFHLLLLALASYSFGLAWQQLLILPSLLISTYFSNKQYQKITRSADDLCWNGECWLMHKADKLNNTFYLDLQPTSWITKQLCLLHFLNDDCEYNWLFSRYELGERMYSQLVYLVKQDMQQSLKENPKF